MRGLQKLHPTSRATLLLAVSFAAAMSHSPIFFLVAFASVGIVALFSELDLAAMVATAALASCVFCLPIALIGLSFGSFALNRAITMEMRCLVSVWSAAALCHSVGFARLGSIFEVRRPNPFSHAVGFFTSQACHFGKIISDMILGCEARMISRPSALAGARLVGAQAGALLRQCTRRSLRLEESHDLRLLEGVPFAVRNNPPMHFLDYFALATALVIISGGFAIQ
jgi:hypothetical protein